tara:strand:+ start:348 stop:536 length:189 start_codon:yes stop_codon:yes gene_type:complete
MRYEYTITDHGTDKEEKVNAMSWKKMFKSLLVRTPKFTGKITYINKKGNTLIKVINNGKVIY